MRYQSALLSESGLDGGIRTPVILLPKQTRDRATLHLVNKRKGTAFGDPFDIPTRNYKFKGIEYTREPALSYWDSSWRLLAMSIR